MPSITTTPDVDIFRCLKEVEGERNRARGKLRRRKAEKSTGSRGVPCSRAAVRHSRHTQARAEGEALPRVAQVRAHAPLACVLYPPLLWFFQPLAFAVVLLPFNANAQQGERCRRDVVGMGESWRRGTLLACGLAGGERGEKT